MSNGDLVKFLKYLKHRETQQTDISKFLWGKRSHFSGGLLWSPLRREIMWSLLTDRSSGLFSVIVSICLIVGLRLILFE